MTEEQPSIYGAGVAVVDLLEPLLFKDNKDNIKFERHSLKETKRSASIVVNLPIILLGLNKNSGLALESKHRLSAEGQ